jgi:hypothetical protein
MIFDYRFAQGPYQLRLDLKKDVIKSIGSLKEHTLRPYINYKLGNLCALSKKIDQNFNYKLLDHSIEVQIND